MRKLIGNSKDQAEWPESVLARYLTVGGATVDVSYRNDILTAICTAHRCPWQERRSVGGLMTDTPEQESARVDEWLPSVQHGAQGHAEKCRAMPRP